MRASPRPVSGALTLLLSLAAVGVARLLPEHGLGLFLRLGAATFLVLLPGKLVARALGFRSTSAVLAWALAAIAVALGVTFLVRASFGLVLVLLLAVAVGAIFCGSRAVRAPRRGAGLVAAVGVVLGLLLWQLAPVSAQGDSLFHLARVRKLVDLGHLTPWRLDELAGGGLHPGYAFPLWHAFLAAVTKLAGVEPALVIQHESSLLVPVALLVAYEAGTFLFRSPALGAATAAAQVALIAFAPGHGGTYPILARPVPAARQLLVPAVLALVFAHAEQPSWRILATVGAASLALTLVHPTYALFLCIPLAGCVVVRALIDRRDTLRIGAGLAAVAVPAAAVLLALLPIARDTVARDPSSRALRRSLAHYHDQLVVHGTSYHLRPEVFGRNGAVAVAGLVLVPLAALAWRRRWSSFVLGGSLAVLAVTLVPVLFEHLSDAVSLSQSRRVAGVLPLAFAFVGGLVVLARLLSVLLLPLALAAGVVFELLWPGDFGFRLERGGPQYAAWIAAAGGAFALAAVLVLVLLHRRPLELDGGGLAALAAGLFVLPVAVHGFAHWSTPSKPDRYALTPALVRALSDEVPKRGVVFSDLETSYRIAAYAPVLIVAAPVEHVANTKQNDPYGRRDDVRAFFATGDLAIPRRYGAQWLVLARFLPHPPVALRPVYSDARFLLYRI
jgi:hypothetical protein